jgi:hypothetical protein
MEYWWNDIDRGKTEVLREKPPHMFSCDGAVKKGKNVKFTLEQAKNRI